MPLDEKQYGNKKNWRNLMNKDNNQHNAMRRKLLKMKGRIFLIKSQLFAKPYLWLIMLLWGYGAMQLWELEKEVVASVEVPTAIMPVWQYSVYGITVIIQIVIFIVLMRVIWFCSAWRDEASLARAFSKQELRNGCPILFSKKKDRKSKVTRREFYSDIPLEVWQENKKAIADNMNVNFVGDGITYGGKNNSNGNKIVIHTKKGRIQEKKDGLHDSEL